MSKTTTDHDTIRTWAEQRGAIPSAVEDTGSGDDPGILRFDFPDWGGDQPLRKLSWDEFFEKFEASKLAFLYEEGQRGGQPSRFNKFVSREA